MHFISYFHHTNVQNNIFGEHIQEALAVFVSFCQLSCTGVDRFVIDCVWRYRLWLEYVGARQVREVS